MLTTACCGNGAGTGSAQATQLSAIIKPAIRSMGGINFSAPSIGTIAFQSTGAAL